MSGTLFRLITKYSILLSVFYILSFAFGRAILNLEPEEGIVNKALIRTIAPLVFNILLNLVCAFIVGRDINKNRVKTRYVTLATIIYRPVGVFAFLLFVVLQEKSRAGTETKGL